MAATTDSTHVTIGRTNSTQWVIGRNLTQLRADRRITQKAAAKGIGILQTHLSDLELGKRSIHPALLDRLATFYGISIDALFDRPEAA